MDLRVFSRLNLLALGATWGKGKAFENNSYFSLSVLLPRLGIPGGEMCFGVGVKRAS